MASRALFLAVLLLSSAAAVLADSTSTGNCVYTIYIRTGKIIKGGTDSIISVTLADSVGGEVFVDNLETWGGLMGEGHDYYERGNLDIFSGRGPCLTTPVCRLNLTSDGSGPHHGWFCNYVEVTSMGPHIPCHQQLFTVDQWLATDAAPYKLTAIRDKCEYVHHQISRSGFSSL